MEPTQTTAPELSGIAAELHRREPIFHTSEFGGTRADFERVMDAGYWEVGASGRRYSREFILEVLETRAPDPAQSSWVVSDFHCREIAADNFLVTYTLLQVERLTRRATLWRRAGADWKILYHQGTVVAP